MQLFFFNITVKLKKVDTFNSLKSLFKCQFLQYDYRKTFFLEKEHMDSIHYFFQSLIKIVIIIIIKY